MNELVVTIFLASMTVLFAASLIVAALKYPMQAFGLCLFILLVLAWAPKSDAATAEITAVVDSATIDKATVERELAAASTVLEQAGVKLVLVDYVVSPVAAHTNPVALLDALNAYKLAQKASTADIYVLFTTRKLSTGSRSYIGYATQGPACAARSAAIVSLQYDGSDSLTLAHEIAHTLGAEHDAVSGYLMSEGPGATSTLSPDTLGVLRGALLDCMPDPVVAKPVVSVPAGTTGGGGDLDSIVVGLLLALLIIRRTRK